MSRRRTGTVLSLALLVAVGACSSGSPGAGAIGLQDGDGGPGSIGLMPGEGGPSPMTPAEAGAADASADAATADSGNGALKIVHVTSTVPTITNRPLTFSQNETDKVEFVAIVTDTGGLDAIAGGTLEDDSGATYGAFGAGSTKGTYSVSLTFTAMNLVRPAEFPRAGGTRKFFAHFFDNAGNQAKAEVDIGLRCRDENDQFQAACAGSCINTDISKYWCGSCTNHCATVSDANGSFNEGDYCRSGGCLKEVRRTCVPTNDPNRARTCDAVCAGYGPGFKCEEVAIHGGFDTPTTCTIASINSNNRAACGDRFDSAQLTQRFLYCECRRY